MTNILFSFLIHSPEPVWCLIQDEIYITYLAQVKTLSDHAQLL